MIKFPSFFVSSEGVCDLVSITVQEDGVAKRVFYGE